MVSLENIVNAEIHRCIKEVLIFDELAEFWRGKVLASEHTSECEKSAPVLRIRRLQPIRKYGGLARLGSSVVTFGVVGYDRSGTTR